MACGWREDEEGASWEPRWQADGDEPRAELGRGLKQRPAVPPGLRAGTQE